MFLLNNVMVEVMEQPDSKESMIKGMAEAARRAGQIIKDSFQGPFSQEFKDQSQNYESLVTEVDTKSQEVIKQALLEGCQLRGIDQNSVGFIGEEDDLHTQGEHTFIVDPTDGTTNFSLGIPFVGVSIAYRHHGETKAGLIYDPLRNVMYSAELGQGAFMEVNGEKKKLEIAEKPLKECLVEAHFNSNVAAKEVEVYGKLYPERVAGIRSFGSLVLGLGFLAENKVNLVINGRAFIWDIAAAELIIKEAGGVMVDWQGKGIQYDEQNHKEIYNLVAGSSENVDEVLKLF
jgi:myo-inositol-1(or 4)-monophosphatase